MCERTHCTRQMPPSSRGSLGGEECQIECLKQSTYRTEREGFESPPRVCGGWCSLLAGAADAAGLMAGGAGLDWSGGAVVWRMRRRGLDSPPFWLYKSLRPVIGRNANRVNLVQVAPMRGFRGPLGFGTSESASVEQKKGVTYAETHSHGNRQRLVRCRGQDWSRAHGT